MPQLQPADFAPQLIWLAIIFTLFYFVLSYLALPRIEQALAERRAKIGNDLQGAREAQTLAEQEAVHYEALITSAKGRGQAGIRASRDKLDAELNSKRGDLDRELAARAAETERRVKALLEKAAGEMEAMTAGVVSDIVKTFGGVEVSDGEVHAALKQGLKG